MMSRDFKGVWIPREVWLCTDLTLFEKALFGEVYSLDGPDGCYASNDYLAEFAGVSDRYVRSGLAKLKRLGLVHDAGFNGRQRILRATLPGTGVPPSPEQAVTSPRNDSSNLLLERKDERKGEGENGAAVPQPPYEQIVGHLNELAGRAFQHTTEGYRKLIRSIWKKLPDLGSSSLEGRVRCFELVHEVKVEQWKGDPKMEHNLRPSTLWRSFERFEQYINENPKYVDWARQRALRAS